MDGVHGEPLDRRGCDFPQSQPRLRPIAREKINSSAVSPALLGGTGAEALIVSQGCLEMSQALREIGETLRELSVAFSEGRTTSQSPDPCLKLGDSLAEMSVSLGEMAALFRCEAQP